MKESWDKTMREITNSCSRSEDLVPYLYNEATRAEALDFENHLQACPGCRAEAKAFGMVRESIGEWRRQALGASDVAESATVVPMRSDDKSPRRRSALVAIREFVTLSPGWMRAATAVIALIFCGLAIIAVAYFVEQPHIVVVEKPETAPAVATEPSNDTVLQSKGVDGGDRKTIPESVIASEQPATQKTANRRALPRLAERHKQIVPQKVSEPATELSATNDYLPFTVPTAEDKLPSLVDLADEPN
ncbi:MAG: hypothetical protein QOJ64_4508 [Acidobacteriota bacterium]|jgi:hypothetical protein|nr:hypothetical protein [Acidobacteriota bacterium]